MKLLKVALAVVLVLAAAPAWLAAQEDLTDPYEIFARHYEAVGGLERFKAEKTSHFEGKVSIFGMEGVVRQWDQHPGKKPARVRHRQVERRLRCRRALV